ncbi:MAG TPA: AAA family ATPase [Conexibacter sp.]|nr:AAA family ATPase [Conexibacter sp.]
MEALAGGTGLLERELELERIERALERASGGTGGLVLVEGPAGIGKTSLVAAARERAAEQELRVLGARAGELERNLAYGVVRQLLERELAAAPPAEREELLSGSAALAAVALGTGDAPSAAPSAADATFSILHGLYWLCANLAARRPLLIAVDDVHWCDAASLRFLVYLATRVDELPIALLVTGRPHEPGAERALVDQLVTTRAAELVRPAALSVAATERVVAAGLERDVAAAFVQACHEATGGNPFLLRELVGALRQDGLSADEHDVPRLRELRPHTVSRSLMLRLARMPPAAGRIASAIAVLGGDVELHVAAQLADVDEARAAQAVDALVAAEILAPARPLAFVHPLVRGAIYADVGPGERAAAHARAADQLLAAGAPPARIAPHLLESTPSGRDAVVAVLRTAADAALAQGAADIAVRYLQRAVDERQGRAEGELLCELGTAEFTSGEQPEAALAHLRAGLPSIADAERRADAWLALSRTTMSYVGVPQAVVVLERALEDLDGLDGERRLRLEVELTCLGVTHAQSHARAAARIDRRSGEVETILGDTLTERLLLCNHAYRGGQRGVDAPRTRELCRRAFAGGALTHSEGTDSSAVNQALYVLVFADAHDDARASIDAALAEASARGSAWGFSAASMMRAMVGYFAGELAAAEADARQALATPGFPPFAAPAVCALLALTLVERGALDRAEAAVTQGGCGPELPPIVHMEPLFFARARLHLACGRDAQALADLHEYGARCERVGAQNPWFPWRAEAAVAHARLGEHARATELADEQLRIARAWGTPSALGVALRAHGLVAGGREGIVLLHDAERALADSPVRLEHAHTLVELGAMLRRDGRRTAAREPLRAGLESARRCGATALVERAHEELVAAGARPRRLMFSGAESLTASERRVASMAAGGRSNREIAQALFVTVKTVENHLHRTYGKLGIDSRERLAQALAGDDAP